jgi:phage baseplate assembly protein W
MPTYTGFSTINANKPQSTNLNAGVDGGFGGTVKPIVFGKKFVLVDEQLIIQDFINALNIQQGQKVGQPQYGTTIWSFIFEPNTLDTQTKLQNEIYRVASQDPRMVINTINVYPQENGILIEIEMAITPMNNAFQLSVFFDNLTNRAVAQ